jgi:hypothetical protein
MVSRASCARTYIPGANLYSYINLSPPVASPHPSSFMAPKARVAWIGTKAGNCVLVRAHDPSSPTESEESTSDSGPDEVPSLDAGEAVKFDAFSSPALDFPMDPVEGGPVSALRPEKASPLDPGVTVKSNAIPEPRNTPTEGTILQNSPTSRDPTSSTSLASPKTTMGDCAAVVPLRTSVRPLSQASGKVKKLSPWRTLTNRPQGMFPQRGGIHMISRTNYGVRRFLFQSQTLCKRSR